LADETTNQSEVNDQKDMTSIETEPESAVQAVSPFFKRKMRGVVKAENDLQMIDSTVSEPDPLVPIAPVSESKKDTARLAIDMPRETHKQLKIYAITQQRTVSSIVTELINQLDLKNLI
jgi:hypothetical protein